MLDESRACGLLLVEVAAEAVVGPANQELQLKSGPPQTRGVARRPPSGPRALANVNRLD